MMPSVNVDDQFQGPLSKRRHADAMAAQCFALKRIYTFLRPSFVANFSNTFIAQSANRIMSSSSDTGFYALKAELPNGKVHDFAELQGKTVLIVNVASCCGFTPQYTGLQNLYDEYKGKGFEILGFPCNQFAGQEPDDDASIQQFCTRNHGVTFPLMKKSDVNGDNTNEVYRWLKAQKSGSMGLTRIKWNFEKFLVDKKGNVVQRWASSTTPESIEAEIAKIV